MGRREGWEGDDKGRGRREWRERRHKRETGGHRELGEGWQEEDHRAYDKRKMTPTLSVVEYCKQPEIGWCMGRLENEGLYAEIPATLLPGSHSLRQHHYNSTLMLAATREWMSAYHAAVSVSPCTVGE